MKVYVKVRREPNHDGDRLLRVVADKKRIKNYSFTVNVGKVRN